MKRSAAKFVPQLLNDDHKQNGVSVYKDLQDQAKNNRNFPSKSIAGDESWVYGLWPRFEGTVQAQTESQGVTDSIMKWRLQRRFQWQKRSQTQRRNYEGDYFGGDNTDL